MNSGGPVSPHTPYIQHMVLCDESARVLPGRSRVGDEDATACAPLSEHTQSLDDVSGETVVLHVESRGDDLPHVHGREVLQVLRQLVIVQLHQLVLEIGRRRAFRHAKGGGRCFMQGVAGVSSNGARMWAQGDRCHVTRPLRNPNVGLAASLCACFTLPDETQATPTDIRRQKQNG
eukprot:scaffold13013_cov128-Isochrysis_galbana.AAC.11